MTASGHWTWSAACNSTATLSTTRASKSRYPHPRPPCLIGWVCISTMNERWLARVSPRAIGLVWLLRSRARSAHRERVRSGSGHPRTHRQDPLVCECCTLVLLTNSFGDVVTSISLLSSCNIVFSNPSSKEKIELFMERRYLTLLAAPSRQLFSTVDRLLFFEMMQDSCGSTLSSATQKTNAMEWCTNARNASLWLTGMHVNPLSNSNDYLHWGWWFKNIWTSKGRRLSRPSSYWFCCRLQTGNSNYLSSCRSGSWFSLQGPLTASIWFC